MRFITFEINGETSWGAITDNGVVDLGAQLGGDLKSIIAEDRLGEAQQAASAGNANYQLGDGC